MRFLGALQRPALARAERRQSAELADAEAAVLKAYALYDPSVGFNIGLGRLAGVLLLYVPAEDAWWLLVALVKKHLAGYHAHDGRMIRTAAYALGKLLNDVDPAVSKRLERSGMVSDEWAQDWLQSCFSRVLPLPTLLRLLDCLMLVRPRSSRIS